MASFAGKEEEAIARRELFARAVEARRQVNQASASSSSESGALAGAGAASGSSDGASLSQAARAPKKTSKMRKNSATLAPNVPVAQLD
jgi:hypothetical protein